MNLSLTLNFNTIAELQAFLDSRTATAGAAVAEKVVSGQPAAVVTPAVVTPAVVTPITPVVAAAVSTAAPVVATVQPGAAEVVDPQVGITPDQLREQLMGRLRQLAESSAEPAEVGKFINSFGVARFSDLPDQMLGIFQGAMNAQFPPA